MPRGRGLFVSVVAVLVAVLPFAVRLAAEETPRVSVIESTDSSELPSFQGEIDVSLVNLYVSVVDRSGDPVSGLTADDFRVFEDGKPVEVTNFHAIHRDQQQPIASGDLLATEPAGDEQLGRYVALLVDIASLERRNLKRLVPHLEEFIAEGIAQRDHFMIARNVGRLEILKQFTANEPSLRASLRRVGDVSAEGDSLKQRKRNLKRAIYRSDVLRAQNQGPGSMAYDLMYSRMMASTMLAQIENLRQQEYGRIRQALVAVDELLRAVAGLPGRKSVIWIGEDLAIRPAVDMYAVFFSQASVLQDFLNLKRPEIWGDELKLDREFQTVAATAQACGATVFIIDASDRDREAGSADFRPPSVESVIAAEMTGSMWTPGINPTEEWQLTEGANFMALSTGGMMFANCRDAQAVVDSLARHVATYYWLGYRRDGPPDGRRHDVRVDVAGGDLRVRHHQEILSRTRPQRLADLAFSKLRLELGSNPLEIDILAETPEPSDGKRFVQPVRINMPIGKLVLLPDAGSHVGQILVAVAVLDDDGNTAPPQLIRMRLEIPSDRYSEDAVASQVIRLLVKEGTRRIAVSVRDEVSGIEGSQAVTLPVQSL